MIRRNGNFFVLDYNKYLILILINSAEASAKETKEKSNLNSLSIFF